jgi:ABC-type Mn2+/Zn2+ transport system ATPase subunit
VNAQLTGPPLPGAPPDDAVLVVDGARLGYSDRVVLDRVDLRIAEGEFWFFLGPNGSGKSTLLRAILGTLPVQAGSIRRSPAVARPARIGFVPQRCDLNPSVPTTVREFVSLGLVGIADARRTGRERMAWALDRSGLAGMAGRDYWSLSGGQRQRALLARALIRRPALYIVDEPTTGLDPPSQDLLMASLADLNRDERLTILFVTHDLPLAARYASHVALFLGGSVEAGPRDAVLRPESLRRAYGLPIELHTEAATRPHILPGAPR